MSRHALWVWNSINGNFWAGRSVLFDLGLITLALLAYDRYYAVKDPANYSAHAASNYCKS